jgi:aryl-alcohol dehydrogenase-like predicted oxidoreductase
MGFGEAYAGFMGDTSKKTAFEILDAFVAGGGNFLDTANNYVRLFHSKFLSGDDSRLPKLLL